jgi:hypothetical protein
MVGKREMPEPQFFGGVAQDERQLYWAVGRRDAVGKPFNILVATHPDLRKPKLIYPRSAQARAPA